MRARSNVALHIFDPVDSYRNIQIRGKLVEITEGGGRENINVLARKYTGEEIYLGPKDEVRVNYIVNIQHNSAQG